MGQPVSCLSYQLGVMGLPISMLCTPHSKRGTGGVPSRSASPTSMVRSLLKVAAAAAAATESVRADINIEKKKMQLQ